MLYYYIKMDWKQNGKDITNDSSLSSALGYGVQMNNDGTIMATSGSQDDNNRGAVFVYKWNGSSWNQLGQKIVGENEGDFFGISIAINSKGNILAAGSPSAGSPLFKDKGAVNVYKWDGSSWNKLGNTLNGVNPGDNFGNDVEISHDGNTLAVSAPNNDGNLYSKNPNTNRGAVYVYKWDGSSWNKLGLGLRPIGEAIDDKIGQTHSLGLSSDGKIISTTSMNSNNEAGYVKFHYLNDSTSIWTQIGPTLRGNVGDLTGRCVEIKKINDSMYRVAVGSSHANNKSGRVDFYNLVLTKHKKYPYKLKHIPKYTLNGELGAGFGRIISLSDNGNTISVCSYLDNNNTSNGSEGNVKIFKFNSTEKKYKQKGKTLSSVISNFYGIESCLSGNGQVIAIGSVFVSNPFVHVFQYK